MNIYSKIAEIQSSIGKMTKDKNNPHFNYKYFDINQILENLQPFLEAQGLILTQPIEGGYVRSVIMDKEDPAQMIFSELALPVNETNPQKIGSCVTYYRRYTLQSLLGLQAEDDDGNKAAAKTAPVAAAPVVLTDDNIKTSISKGTQSDVIKGILSGKYTATENQLIKLQTK